MTPADAEALAAATLAEIPTSTGNHPWDDIHVADRERVASDLAGLMVAYAHDSTHNDHAARYADNLRRTAALYGVTP